MGSSLGGISGFFRWPSRAATVLIPWVLASGACLQGRLPDRREVAPRSAPTPSFGQPPSQASVPAAGYAVARSTSETESFASDSSTPSNPAWDDQPAFSVDSAIRETWSTPSDSVAGAPKPPLAGDFEPVSVAGHLDAWVSLPTGATSRRPVVIVIHGAGDRPERQCRGWRHATSEYPFVICPRGRAAPRYTHIGGAALLEYIDGALDALAARYPDYVDTDKPLLAGFSLGAAQVTELAARLPDRFPRIALVEGATKAWSRARAASFLEGGGQRVLFGCGQDGVRDQAERTAKRLASLGLDAHVVFANVGHKFAPSLQDAVRGELAWLMEGDERWPTQ
jgi:pimeloyl-ACP methyl ester carboxylesterase